MSWSVSYMGKPEKVAEKIAADLARYKCTEPEETVKTQVGQAIAAALAAFPTTSAVRVEANGSQNVNAQAGGTTNSLNVKIEPIYGFVE